MIYSFIHPGSGLGNQLHRIVAGKVLALDKGYEYAAIGRESFKGKSFMDVDLGKEISYSAGVTTGGKIQIFDLEKGKETRLWEEKTNYYNPEFDFIEDNTVIDGEFQSEQYFGHRLSEVDQWLKVEPIKMPDDVCVIGFRGGEFYQFPELGLPKEYFDEGMAIMRKVNPDMKFEVHTDDLELAEEFFRFSPIEKITHDIGINWRSVRYAKYAIIANSSFYILPRLLRQRESEGRIELVTSHAVTIAPRYWARRNTKEWSMPQNYYSCFCYI